MAQVAEQGVLHSPQDPSRPRRPAGLWPLVVFLCSLLVYSAVAFSLYDRREPSGDESAYLLMAHSIAFDGDVDLRNNLEGQEYRSFFHDPGQAACEPAFDLRGDGTRRSIHGVGLPVFIALPYRFGGRLGAGLAVAGSAAIMSALLFLAAWEVSGDLRASLASWGLVCFTIPIVPHMGQIFPEIPGATLLLLSCFLILRSARSPRWILIAGLPLALLPWLHTRYILLAGIVLLWAAARMKDVLSGKALLRFLGLLFLPTAASLVGLALLLQRWYGSPWPTAPYQISLGWPWFVFSLEHIYLGIAGLFFDQEFGLLFYAPFYLAALAGLGLLFRHRRDVALVIVLSLGGLTLLAATFIMWWGGDSAPARLIAPAVPLLGIPLATALSHWRRWWFRVPFTVLAAISLLMAAGHLVHPEWYHAEDDDRTARPLKELGLERWAPLFPSTAVRVIRYGAHGLPFEAGEVRIKQGEKVVYVGPGHRPGSRVQQLSVRVPRGDYRIRCRMYVAPLSADPSVALAILRLSSEQGQLPLERQLTSTDLPALPSFQDYDLVVHSNSVRPMTFEVYYTGAAALWLESTTVGPAQRFVDSGKVGLWMLALAALALGWNRRTRAATGSG